MLVEGRCHCGEVGFTAEVEPHTVTICHCSDCQGMSGTAFRANVSCPADRFNLIQGEPRTYIKIADSGARRSMAFCGTCGTQLYARSADSPAAYSLRTGVLKQRAALLPAKQIWLRSAVPWARSLLDVPGFEAEPT